MKSLIYDIQTLQAVLIRKNKELVGCLNHDDPSKAKQKQLSLEIMSLHEAMADLKEKRKTV